jgi:hypothetical protein
MHVLRSLPRRWSRFIKQSRFIQLCSFHKCQVRDAAPNVCAQLGTLIWCTLPNIVDDEFTANLNGIQELLTLQDFCRLSAQSEQFQIGGKRLDGCLQP